LGTYYTGEKAKPKRTSFSEKAYCFPQAIAQFSLKFSARERKKPHPSIESQKMLQGSPKMHKIASNIGLNYRLNAKIFLLHDWINVIT